LRHPGIDLIQTLKACYEGNGQTYTRSFDSGPAQNPSYRQRHPTLTYDSSSRITQTTDTNPAYKRTYDYDELDRLISQSDNTGFKLWGCDANSNRTNAQIGATNYSSTLDVTSNHLQLVAGPV